jgi:hypothetical protein
VVAGVNAYNLFASAVVATPKIGLATLARAILNVPLLLATPVFRIATEYLCPAFSNTVSELLAVLPLAETSNPAALSW